MKETGARRDPHWARYHTELYDFDIEGNAVGVLGCAVGASFAVLVAEELFASGCRVLLSVTSAGRIVPAGEPPYYVLIDRAVRDQGTAIIICCLRHMPISPMRLSSSHDALFLYGRLHA